LLEAELRLTWKDQLNILSVSDGFEGLLGFKQSDVLSGTVPLQDLIHPTDLPRVRALFSAGVSLRTGEFPLRMRGANGRMRCLGFRYALERRSPAESLVVARIAPAPQPEAQQEIRERALEVLAVLDGVDQCACVKDRYHLIRFANKAFGALLSSEGRDPAGLTDYDLFPEEYADRSYDAEEKIFGGEPAARFAVEISGRPSTMRSLESRSLPMHDRRGRVAGMLSVVADHTARARAEQVLRISERSLKEAHRIAGVASFDFDVRLQTWTASEAFYELLGLDRDCARTANTLTNLISKEDHARLSSLYGEVASGRDRQLECETRFIRPKEKVKETRWARVRCFVERDAQAIPLRLHGTLEEITERKLAEAQAHQSANLLQLFIQDAPAGVAMFDEQLRYMGASRRWIEDRGLHAWEIVGRSMYDLHPWIPESWKDEHRRALGGETIQYHEDCFENGHGRERCVRRMVQPWWSSDGKVGGIVVFSEDITAQKAAQNALREREESLREAQGIARVGSYIVNVAQDVWTSSEALDEIFGIGPEYERNLEGWKALVHPDEREMMASYAIDEVLGQGQPFNREYRIVRPLDQSVRWVHGLGRVERDADGQPKILRGTIQDVTERKRAEGSLRESEQLLQLFTEHAPAAIAMFDREMRYLAVSRRWIEAYELEGRQVIGRSHYDVFPDLPERWREAHRRGMDGEGLRQEEDLFERKDGKHLWVRWELLPWTRSDGSVGGIVLFTEDITALKESAERLQLAASVFTHTSESILITDGNGAILDANDAFSRIYGYTREEILGKNPRLLNSGRQSREFYAEMWAQLKSKGQWSGEIWNRAKNGQLLPGILTISAVPDAMGRAMQYVGLFSDLSPVKEQERQLRRVAHFDVLTGLPNRVLLADRLQQAMAQARRTGRIMVLAYVDLDDFTAINERHGHMVGDRVLSAVALRLSTMLRETDTLARLGGDEFAAVLQDLENMEEGLTMVSCLRNALVEPVEVDDLKLRLTASVGVTLYPQADEVEPDQLVRQADQAMYFAKLAGKARQHIFDPMLDRTMRGRHEDLRRIRQALESEEFELYFQPKVNMRTGSILGAEALIRWRHPELGVLLPQHFLPVMEGNVLSVELGEWVIANALARLETWQAQGLDIPVSVNVDAMQLQDPRFVERLKEMLGRHPRIPPSKLELEVLESSAFQDVSQVSEVIRACSKLGVSFALDDFGTGYSSLSYLKRLPVDVLKIDRSFVHDMLDDPEDLSILEGVLVLANAFRRQVIAEGVETVEHGLMLLRLGCQVGQGYQIARPMSGKDFPGWAAAWRPDPRWTDVAAIDPIKWPALHAGVEHRAWVLELEEFLEGRRLTAPEMDPHLCRFGRWLESEASVGHSERPEFRSVYEMHRELHAHADVLLKRKGRNGDGAAEELPALRALRDGLLDKLQQLVQTL